MAGTRNVLLALIVTMAGIISLPQANAQPKPGYEPSSTHIFPAGGRRGTTIQVRVGTECAPPGTNFYISGEGVHAPETLGDNVTELGEVSPRRVPTEIPITYPREWLSEIAIANDAPLGAAHWRLSCAQGGTASRPFLIGDLPEFIESESNSTLDRADSVTLPVTINGQINGERDIDYFSFYLEAGETVEAEIVCGRLGSRLDPIVELIDVDRRPLRVQRRHVGSDPVLTARVESAGQVALRIANVSFHGDPSYVYRINLSKQPSVRTDAFEINEPEPNGTRTEAQVVDIPCSINGRFETRDDEDWLRFRAEKDKRLSINCRAAAVGMPTLPSLLLTNEQGDKLASSSSVESDERECRLEWQAPAAGDYLLRARDVRFGSRGGEEFAYRLTISETTPDYSLSIDSDNVNVGQGNKAQVKVHVERTGGFNGPIEMRCEGLPEQVTLENSRVAENQTSVDITIVAGDEAAARSWAYQLIGTAEIDGAVTKRIAHAKHLGRDSEGVSIGPPTLDRLHVTVTHKPLFKFHCGEAYQYAHRGSVFPYPMEIERLDGFDGEVHIQRGDRQNRDMDGVQILDAVISPGSNEAIVPIYLPESMHINVQSQSQLYSQAYAHFTDKHGREQSVLVLSEKRNMLRTLPPVVKLNAVDEQLTTKPGGQVVCRLQLDRTTNFPGPMQLMLHDPLPDGVRVEPVTIAAGEEDVELVLRVKPDVEPGEARKLIFRATGHLNDEVVVISEATLMLQIR